MVLFYMKGWSYLSCNNDCNRWIRTHYARYEYYVQRHHWKILLAGVAFLGLCWLGFKSMDFERDIVKLWIYNSSRLHNETSYILQRSSNQIDRNSIETILQVTRSDILSTQLLLEHVQLLELIMKLTVRYDGRVFTLHQLCRQVQLPRMHYLDYNIRTDIENMMPCEIVTPLNCFWEGSKLLNSDNRISTSGGDNYHSVKIDWRTFDFTVFLNTFKDMWQGEFFVNLFNETGIGRGYITKPCIDITDPLCPNKNRKLINLESVLENGCYQIAENLYNYPKSILIGEQNHAIQTMIFLRSAADVFQTMRTNELDWSEDKVQHVIDLWQRKLRETIMKYNRQRPYLESMVYRNIQVQSKRIEKSSFYTFTNNSLQIAMEETNADETMATRYLICGGLLTLFVAIMFVSSNNAIRSHCWLAITGTVLLLVATVAGLGLSAAIGLKFTVLTLQVVPFIVLGLGIDDVLVLTGCYSRHMVNYLFEDMATHPVHQTLNNCATIILMSFLVKISIIGGISFIPGPLMRNFCGQVLLITIFQTGTIAFLYPCLLYLDSIRQHDNRIDILCCLRKGFQTKPSVDAEAPLPQYDRPSRRPDVASSQIVFSTEFTTSPDNLIPDNVRQYVEINPLTIAPQQSTSVRRQTNSTADSRVSRNQNHKCCWKFRYRISKTFLHIIALMPVHITIMLLSLAIVVLGVYSAININCGLKLESIFLRDSNEYNYVKYESTEFRMNNFDVVTKEIDYINYQELVLQLNEELKAVANVKLFGNGKFWLSSFILWLERLQYDFDSDMREKLIFPNGTWLTNASKNGLLAMTLLVQDRGSINYKRLGTARLVQSQQVDQTNFYLYLNVWRSVSSDYDTMPCILYPQTLPFNMDNFIPNVERMRPSIVRLSGKNLFKANPLQFVSCKYFHRGIYEKDELSFVKTIRSITSTFSDKGIGAMPLGNVFSLSEQYISLRYQIMIAALISFICVLLLGLLISNHWLVAVIICLLLGSSLCSPFLFLSIYHLPLNSTSGVMALWSGGLGLRLSILVIVSYAETSDTETLDSVAETSEQDYSTYMHVSSQVQNRMRRVISNSPCGSALISTLLTSAFMYMTNVTYIWEHFLLLPLVGMMHCLFNGYCLSPILCFYLLPHNPMISSTVTKSNRKPPKTTTSKVRSQIVLPRKKSRSRPNAFINLEGDRDKLSTIPEESSSMKSSVASHTSRDNCNKAPSLSSSSTSSSSSPSSAQSQEYPQYIEQNVESSLMVQYPSVSASAVPELALKTSFKYRKPVSTGI